LKHPFFALHSIRDKTIIDTGNCVSLLEKKWSMPLDCILVIFRANTLLMNLGFEEPLGALSLGQRIKVKLTGLRPG